MFEEAAAAFPSSQPVSILTDTRAHASADRRAAVTAIDGETSDARAATGDYEVGERGEGDVDCGSFARKRGPS
ncbi:hypothetical protein PsYK624_149840 [Phanerochaete sordida]|uniref:Uncharacterized protein n=1 Tax=Phanerochaete sordida TaxID=48140 RepID=A0A9P3GMY3_9APHY|nr:hypothetical protein PsYK624_149840 [Phanerochaete sordida]